MMNRPYYPVGIQNFSEIRHLNAVYVDKTALVHELTHTSKYVFLSRPRRFGKSLLSSTFQCYFEGRRELFTGLAIDQLETEWTVYPVLHFDLSKAKDKPLEGLVRNISIQLKQFEELYGRDEEEVSPGERLNGVISRAHRKTGQKVVVLIDEYDAPVLDVLHEPEEKRDEIRRALREFYSPLKSCDPDLRFVFITGISTFSQLSIFSELNNLENISKGSKYATICGITKPELLANFQYGIAELSKAWKISEEEVVEKLQDNYDGYHFNHNSEGVFNPFSLLKAFKEMEADNYWFQSATPKFLVEMLKKYADEGMFDLNMLGEQRNLTASGFDTPIEAMSGPLPLLYQSGYLTIKDYDAKSNLYALDVPNAEVRVGLMENLLPIYSNLAPQALLGSAFRASVCLSEGDYEGALKLLQSLLSSVPFMRGDEQILADEEKTEAYYHRLFYFFFRTLCNEVNAEVRSAKGAADVVVFTRKYIYIIEIKINANVQTALRQIEEKRYAAPYLTDGREVIKVGVSFSTSSRTIEQWGRA